MSWECVRGSRKCITLQPWLCSCMYVLRLRGSRLNVCFSDGEGRKTGFGMDLDSGRSIVLFALRIGYTGALELRDSLYLIYRMCRQLERMSQINVGKPIRWARDPIIFGKSMSTREPSRSGRLERYFFYFIIPRSALSVLCSLCVDARSSVVSASRTRV